MDHPPGPATTGRPTRRIPGTCAALALLVVAGGTAQALTLAEAERLALERDPMVRQLVAEGDAARAMGQIEGQLPPPQARLGIVNLPVDSFDFDADDMTMVELGISQEFMGGERRALARRAGEQGAAVRAAQAEDRARALRREVRRTWTELAWLAQADAVLDDQAQWLEQLRRSARSRYAAGEGSQLELLRAGYELAMLRERELDLERESARMRVELARWIGGDAAREASSFVLPEPTALPPLAVLRERLAAHPAQFDYERRIEAGQTEVDLARAARRPEWMLDLGYGLRSGRGMDGAERSNMLSAMVTVGLPRLRPQRLDAAEGAARAELRAVRAMHEEHQREFESELELAWTAARRIDELLAFYDTELLPLAGQSGTAALLALRHDRGGVEEVVSARQLALETRLKRTRLLADRAQAQHELDYLTGEMP